MGEPVFAKVLYYLYIYVIVIAENEKELEKNLHFLHTAFLLVRNLCTQKIMK